MHSRPFQLHHFTRALKKAIQSFSMSLILFVSGRYRSVRLCTLNIYASDYMSSEAHHNFHLQLHAYCAFKCATEHNGFVQLSFDCVFFLLLSLCYLLVRMAYLLSVYSRFFPSLCAMLLVLPATAGG